MLTFLKGRIAVSVFLILGVIGCVQSACLRRVCILLIAAGLGLEGSFVFTGAWKKHKKRAFLAGLSVFGVILLSGATWQAWILRDDPRLLTFVITVWAVDTLAFLGGKIFGGPRLALAISPGKTWSGFIVGVGLGHILIIFLVMWGMLKSLAGPLYLPLWPLLAQGGDLLVSSAKRRLHIKDSSTLLAGHGGLWDRFDSLIFLLFCECLRQFLVHSL